jgi:hypothetical protein
LWLGGFPEVLAYEEIKFFLEDPNYKMGEEEHCVAMST